MFDALRPRLHGIAYRMTGSVSDADDLCQEAWLRWAAADRSTVANPEAFLVVTVSRLSIDRLRSATRRRETYVGPYLPEPIVADPWADGSAGDPAEQAELADSLTYAFLVMLDELTPVERAVLLLHDVFSYPFDEVAAAVDRSPDAVRQIASRSRRKVAAHPSPLPRAEQDQVARTLGGLLADLAVGNVEAVIARLAPNVVVLSDGGAQQRAGRRPVIGADRVARFLVNLARRNADLGVRFVEVNARPGLLFTRDDRPFMVMTAELDADGRVAQLFSQLNPDKLHHLA
jgi:RNA polymerase sigma-70 factor (ECF subfamily)